MRLKTGVVQAEGDWPGVFIRGDNVGDWLFALDVARQLYPGTFERERELLLACKANEDKECPNAQQVIFPTKQDGAA